MAKISTANKFRKMAEIMQKQIDAKSHTASMAGQNYTHRRARIAASAQKDLEVLTAQQSLLRSFADAIDNRCLPLSLAYIKTKSDFDTLARIVLKQMTEIPHWLKATIIEKFKVCENEYEQFYTDLMSVYEGIEVEDHEEEITIMSMVGNIPGFFPTPDSVSEMMLEQIRDIPSPLKILEPSAGSGNLCRAVQKAFPKAEVDVIEYAYSLAEYLMKQGWNLVSRDIMEYTPDHKYHLAFMNPPFENGISIDHVRRVATMIAPGGSLVSIMPSSVLHRSDTKHAMFQDWVEGKGGDFIILPKDSFKESGTGVSAVMLVIKEMVEK